MPRIKSDWLRNAYTAYVDNWLWDEWGYESGWRLHFAEMILWYSTAGFARGGERMADTFVEYVRRRQPSRLPEMRRRTWADAKKIAAEICKEQKSNPVDWFTGGCRSLAVGWKRLDDITGIGPKIAAFIMRDLSFMRDYSDGKGGIGIPYRTKRNTHWFDKQSPEDQALFLPIDIYVCRGARRHCASRTCANYRLAQIQQDCNLHHRAAIEIVKWSRRRGFDPRELDVYWYSLAAGDIHKDGTEIEEE